MNHQTACEALQKGVRLHVQYDGFFRIVEVHAVGVSTANHDIMRVWQVSGGSVHNEPVGWKILRLDEATGGTFTNDPSAAPRPGYKRGDKAMRHIYCQI